MATKPELLVAKGEMLVLYRSQFQALVWDAIGRLAVEKHNFILGLTNQQLRNLASA